MKRLCSVCVRGNSKGVPNKNIRPLLGKPLLLYSLDQARDSGFFDCIVVNSDSREILQLAKDWGVDFAIKRPAEMATDTAAKLPVIKHSFSSAETLCGITFDTVVDLDATSPLRNQEDIEGAIKLLESGDSVTNVITGTNARRSPYFNLIELDKSGEVHLSGERKKWKEMLVSPDTSIKEALNVIERVEQIVFVIDLNGRLLGTVTDHDVRTSFLQGVKLDEAVKNIMNTNPTTASNEMSEEKLWKIFESSDLLHIPVINSEKKLINVRNMNRIVRRQDAPPCFDMNTSIYVWCRDSLLNSFQHVIQPGTRLYVMPEERSVDIDSELDFRWVEFLMQEKLNRKN